MFSPRLAAPGLMPGRNGRPMPRFNLAALPTPLLPAHRLQAAIGGPLIWVKRDDLTGFATAGNKARTLEFLIGDALDQRCDVLVSGGGPSSNFCAAAAAAARAAGLDCDLVLYGAPPDPHQPPHPNLSAALESGAHVEFTGRPGRDEVDRAIPSRAAARAAQGRRPYVMPRGGATAVGAAGFARARGELAAQLDVAAVDPGIIVVATGSGGTQAGLVAGRAPGTAPQPRVLGATVSRPPAQIRDTVADLAYRCAALLGRPLPKTEDVEIVDARGGGFGVPSDAGERARLLAHATEGLVLDPVYSAKAFAVVLDLVTGGFTRPIVFWHTGGLPAAIHHLTTSERSALCPT
ncbi:MAG: D-cysteine desulfhydrase [Acidimicrobiaceae bacterium]|nr:D-cysteine desulfhydrase [Acidimicrobiaceae bacterium]